MEATFEAWLEGDNIFFADTKVHFAINDDYDFDRGRTMVVNRYGVGEVPHDWLVNLKDAKRAAEFKMYAIWSEHLFITGALNTINVQG